MNRNKAAAIIEGPEDVLNSNDENNPMNTDNNPAMIDRLTICNGLLEIFLAIAAAMARNISSNPLQMVSLSIIAGLLSVFIGLFSSLEFNTSSGPSIIAAALFLFILSLLNIKQSIKLKN